ncbi:MAG: 16S rRNA (cytosine(1402)-N(4))-methyltransferase RsmH [Pseudomonadota bacterium]
MSGDTPEADRALHQPVLLDAVLNAVLGAANARPRRVLDATFGRGGHSRALLERLPENAELLVMDRDPAALDAARRLAASDSRVRVLAGAFADLDALLAASLGASVLLDAVLFDLGVSSPQLDDGARGFSLRHAGPLDMRMDPTRGISAAEWLNGTTETELISVLRRYGEISYAPRLARAILGRRPITTTDQLAQIVVEATPAPVRRKQGKTHEATRCFQAIRIHVNDELGQIDAALPKAFAALGIGGRLAVISFHSLEDRRVKRFMRERSQPPRIPRRLPVTDAQLPKPPARALGGPIRAPEHELERNARARSATLRVLERTA